MTDAAGGPVLRGERVTLRPWRRDDVDAVTAACQDAEIQRWTTVPSPYTRAHAEAFLTEVAMPATAAGQGVYLAVADPGSDAVLGSFSATLRAGVAHIGYWLAPQARGRGLATEALRLLTAYLIEPLGCVRVELVVEPANSRSRALPERLGFVLEGVLRRRLSLHGQHRDVAMYSMLADDAAASRLVVSRG